MEKKRILIADDEEGVRFLLSRALEDEIFDVEVAENGLDAFNQINNKSYDLIITDYMMPQMDGFELIEKINKKYPDIPTILITAYGPGLDCQKSGATASIRKPFEIYDLKALVNKLVSVQK